MNLPTSVAAACQVIAEDRLKGAHDLATMAVKAMTETMNEAGSEMLSAEELVVLMRTSATSLARVRPAVTAIANAVAELVHRIEEACKVTDVPLSAARKIASRYLAEFDRAIEMMSQEICSVISSDHVVMTLSKSRTVLEGLKAAHPSRVIVAESRPLFEGRQTAAELLAVSDLDVELVSDAAAPGLVEEVEVVLTGANAILADGSLVNKVGTLGIALAADAASVPMYAACESLKISPGQSMLAELHPRGELWRNAPAGIGVRNFYVERVSPKLLSGIVTERGVIEPREAMRIASAKRRALKSIGVGEA